MSNDHHSSRSGISRIELIVAFVIVALLAAFLIPAVQSARERARQTECNDNLHQLGLGLHTYYDVYSTFPPGCVGNPKLPPEKRWGWYLSIGNYLSHYGHPLVDYDRAWDDPDVQPLMMHIWENGTNKHYDSPLMPVWITTCPSSIPASHKFGHPFTDYVGIGGVGRDGPLLPRDDPRAGMWAYDDVTSFDDCIDGMANTLFIVETAADRGCWLAGGSATVRPVVDRDQSPIGTGRQFGGMHPGGAMALFVDGHVSFLSDSIDLDPFQQGAKIAGADDIDTLDGTPLKPASERNAVDPVTPEEHVHSHE